MNELTQKQIEPSKYDGYELVKFLHLVLLMATFGFTYLIMFG